MKSKPLISCWLSGVPTLKRDGDCASATAGAARNITGTSSLREHRIGYAPVAGHFPGLHGIVMLATDDFFRVRDAPVLVQLCYRRLHFTLVIGATRQDHRLFTVPSPVEVKPRMRLRQHWRLKLRFFPGSATVGGYIDLPDCAPAGPGQAGDLHVARAGDFQS